jgi:hypothetical protein
MGCCMSGMDLPRASNAAGSAPGKNNTQDTAARIRGQLLGERGSVTDAAGLDVVRSAK